MSKPYVFTEADVKIIQDLLARERSRVTRPRAHDVRLHDDAAPDFYVAKTPEDGIPGLEEDRTDTGTGYGEDDTPGSAECDIYKVTDGVMEAMGFTLLLHNLSPLTIPPFKWVFAERDKTGTWWAKWPFQPCIGTDLRGFSSSPGAMNVMTLDHNGCIVIRQADQC